MDYCEEQRSVCVAALVGRCHGEEAKKKLWSFAVPDVDVLSGEDQRSLKF